MQAPWSSGTRQDHPPVLAAAAAAGQGSICRCRHPSLRKPGCVQAVGRGDACHAHASSQPASRTAALIRGTGPAQRGALDAHLSAVQLHGSCPGPLGCCTTVSAHPHRGRRRELSLGLKRGLLLCAHGSCIGGSSAVGVNSRRFCWPGGSPPEACGGAGDEARVRVHVQLGRSFPMLTRPVPGGTPLGQLGRSCPKPPLLTGARLKGALTVVSQGLGPRAGASGRL